MPRHPNQKPPYIKPKTTERKLEEDLRFSINRKKLGVDCEQKKKNKS